MEIQVAAEVAAVVPEEMLQRWRHDPGYEQLVCKRCMEQITGSMALVVLYDAALGATLLVPTHPDCQVSAVLEADLRDQLLPEDGLDVRLTASQWLGPAGPMASLLVETRVTIALPAGDDVRDLLTATALGLGLHLVGALGIAPAVPSRPGWEIVLAPQGDGEYAVSVQTPDGEFANGVFRAPGPGWEALVRHGSTLTLLVGTTMLSDDELPAAQTSVVEHLADRGRLAGATVPARFTS